MDRAGLADRHEPGAELDRHARREHEAARLDPGHFLHGSFTKRLRDRRRCSRQEPVLGEEPERVGMAFEVLQLRDELVVEGRHARDASLCARITITITGLRPTAAR